MKKTKKGFDGTDFYIISGCTYTFDYMDFMNFYRHLFRLETYDCLETHKFTCTEGASFNPSIIENNERSYVIKQSYD